MFSTEKTRRLAALGLCLLLCLCACDREKLAEPTTDGSAVTEKADSLSPATDTEAEPETDPVSPAPDTETDTEADAETETDTETSTEPVSAPEESTEKNPVVELPKVEFD